MKSARTVGLSTEVLWNDFYKQVRDLVPADTVLASFVVDGRAPWEPESTPDGPLRQPRVATITFVLVSSTGPIAVEAFVKKVSEIKGFVDVNPGAVALKDGLYGTTFTIDVGADALAGRFAAGEDGGN